MAQATGPEAPQRWVSRTGREFIIRPIVPADEEELVAFGKRLSPRSVRQRFLTPRVDFDSAYWRQFVHQLTNVDYHRRTAFVVTNPDEAAIRAVGRYEEDGPGSAEVALAVEDSLQGQGIGTELLYHLADHARAHGYATFTAWMLAENIQMRDVFRYSGFPCRFVPAGNLVSVRLDIRERPACPPWRLTAGAAVGEGRATPPPAPAPG
ncbi:MAG: hypothetical protein Kow0010_04320 [Dehalococcoidia bacterium]